MRNVFPPERIVGLTEETVETLYLLGEEHRIVGISGYTVRPPRTTREKPRVSAFTSADIPKILALEPDLLFDVLRSPLGAMVGAADRADRLASELEQGIAAARLRAARLPWRPKVYFEEWDEPMISGIGWVSELIETAGGVDIFADRATFKSAKERIVSAAEVIERQPDIIVGSWCGKKFRPERLARRPGFDRLPAVRSGALHEIKSSFILQPGPAALTDGLAALETIIAVPTKALAVFA